MKLKWWKIILSYANFKANLYVPRERYCTSTDGLKDKLVEKVKSPLNVFGAVYRFSSDEEVELNILTELSERVSKISLLTLRFISPALLSFACLKNR